MSKVTLGQVATEVRESTKDPAGLPIVGLEHLIPGEIRLTQWSETSENTFTKLFHKGQVLFGRRRAYQKKAAVADFDGVCSGDITVIAAKPDRLLPDLLPFIVNDDRFFDFAMEKSAGSLSPRVKWAQLAEYAFDLPDDIEEQRSHAKLLWAIERSRSAYQNLLSQMDELVKSQFVEMFGDPFESPKWETRSLFDVISSIDDGSNVDTSAYASEGKIVFLRIQNVWRDEIRLDDVVYISESTNQRYATTTLLTGDLLITKIGRINTTDSSLGRVSVYRGDNGKANYSNNIMRIRFTDEVKSEFINTLMNLPKYQLFIRQSCQGSTDKRALSKAVIGKYPIVVPPIELQEQYIDFYRQTDKSKLAIRQALESLEKSRSAIMTKVFG